MTNEIKITKKGNAVGFTAQGETITGCFMPKRNAWRIAVADAITSAERLTDERNKNFADLNAAKQYAISLIDAKMTQKLAWWTL